MRRLAELAVVAALITFTACHRKDPLWCPDEPGNTCPTDAPTDTPPLCSSADDCGDPTPACDIAGSMMCVECVAPEQVSACSGTTPVCGDDHTCRACKAHDECASSACLDDGTCASESDVAYVDPEGTDNDACTKAMPCIKVAKALATNRPYVKFHGTTDEQVSIVDQNVTLLAEPGAKLTSTSNGLLLEVRGASVVTIYGLEISGGSGASGFGISMPAGNTAKLTLRRVKVTGNAAGGITISGGEFDIANTIIAGNGNGTTSGLGGVKIDSITTAGTHRLEFNTITANVAAATVHSGVNCGTVTMPLTFTNNIIYGNFVSGGGSQIGGSANCLTAYSDIGPDNVTGNNNINNDPNFINPATGNFHLSAASPCKDAADPAATLDEDLDRDTRPQGAGHDIGADEVK